MFFFCLFVDLLFRAPDELHKGETGPCRVLYTLRLGFHIFACLCDFMAYFFTSFVFSLRSISLSHAFKFLIVCSASEM